MDSEVILKLQLSESEQARLLALDSETTTPDEAKAIANNAIDAHFGLAGWVPWFRDNGFPQYAEYVDTYDRMFIEGLKKTYSAAVLGSGYFASFKGQVSDKWQEEPWEANKTYIANFLNDGRGSTLEEKNESIRRYFDELPFAMKKLRLQLDDKDVHPSLRGLLNAATAGTAEVDGFGKSWNTFYQDVKLIRDKAEIAVDSATKTYLTERVKILGDLSKTLAEAMGVYAQILHDKGIYS